MEEVFFGHRGSCESLPGRSTIEEPAVAGRGIAGVFGQAAVRMGKLLGKAHAILDNSWAPQAMGFDVVKWFGQWIERSLPALGWRRPIELIAAPTSRRKLLGVMESGTHQ